MGSPIAAAIYLARNYYARWSRTLRTIRPEVMLVAEDPHGWDAVTKPPAQGGLASNAVGKWRFITT